MQCEIRHLSVLAYANGFTLWHYKVTTGSVADVGAEGFFQSAGDMLASGDMVLVSGSDGGRLAVIRPCGNGLQACALV